MNLKEIEIVGYEPLLKQICAAASDRGGGSYRYREYQEILSASTGKRAGRN